MSVISNTSSSKNIMNKSDIFAILSNLESQVSALRTILNTVPDNKKPGRPSSKKASVSSSTLAPVAVPAPSPASDAASTVSTASKPKREINPQIVEYNKDRTVIFAELRKAWVAKNPALADLAGAAWAELPEAADKDAKKSHNKAVKDFKEAIKTANVEAPPTYPDALKEHSRRLKEAKGTSDAVAPPKAAKKAATKDATKAAKPADTDTDTAASVAKADSVSVASSTDAPAKKRRGRPAMTADEKAAAKATRKAVKKAAKKVAELPPLPPSPVMDGDSLDTESESETDIDV